MQEIKNAEQEAQRIRLLREIGRGSISLLAIPFKFGGKLNLNNLIKSSQEPSWLGRLIIGSGLGTVGGGMYLLNKEHQKKKADQKSKDATKKE